MFVGPEYLRTIVVGIALWSLCAGCKTTGSGLLDFEDTVLGEKDIQRLNDDFQNVMIRPRNPYHAVPFAPPDGVAYADPDLETYLPIWNLYRNFVDVTAEPPVMNKYKVRFYLSEAPKQAPINSPDTPSFLRKCARTSCTENPEEANKADIVAETTCELEEFFKAIEEFRVMTDRIDTASGQAPDTSEGAAEGSAGSSQNNVAFLQNELAKIKEGYDRRTKTIQSLQACWKKLKERRNARLQIPEIEALLAEPVPKWDDELRSTWQARMNQARAKQCPNKVKDQANYYLTYDLMNYAQPNLARNLLVQIKMGTLDNSVLQGFDGSPNTLSAERTAPVLFVAGSAHNLPETFWLSPDRYYTVKDAGENADLSQVNPANSGVALPEADPGDFQQSRDNFGSLFSRGMLVGLAKNETGTDLTKTIMGTKFAIANVSVGTDLIVYQRGKALPVSFGKLRVEQGDPKSLSANQGIENLAGAYWEGLQVKVLCAEICPANRVRFVNDEDSGPNNPTGDRRLGCNWDSLNSPAKP